MAEAILKDTEGTEIGKLTVPDDMPDDQVAAHARIAHDQIMAERERQPAEHPTQSTTTTPTTEGDTAPPEPPGLMRSIWESSRSNVLDPVGRLSGILDDGDRGRLGTLADAAAVTGTVLQPAYTGAQVLTGALGRHRGMSPENADLLGVGATVFGSGLRMAARGTKSGLESAGRELVDKASTPRSVAPVGEAATRPIDVTDVGRRLQERVIDPYTPGNAPHPRVRVAANAVRHDIQKRMFGPVEQGAREAGAVIPAGSPQWQAIMDSLQENAHFMGQANYRGKVPALMDETFQTITHGSPPVPRDITFDDLEDLRRYFGQNISPHLQTTSPDAARNVMARTRGIITGAAEEALATSARPELLNEYRAAREAWARDYIPIAHEADVATARFKTPRQAGMRLYGGGKESQPLETVLSRMNPEDADFVRRGMVREFLGNPSAEGNFSAVRNKTMSDPWREAISETPRGQANQSRLQAIAENWGNLPDGYRRTLFGGNEIGFNQLMRQVKRLGQAQDAGEGIGSAARKLGMLGAASGSMLYWRMAKGQGDWTDYAIPLTMMLAVPQAGKVLSLMAKAMKTPAASEEGVRLGTMIAADLNKLPLDQWRKQDAAEQADYERIAPGPDQSRVDRPSRTTTPTSKARAGQDESGHVREPYPSELKYFQAHPDVGGMATEDNRIILNPYSKANKQAIIKNEGARIQMRTSGPRPSFAITPEQRARFKGYGSEQDIRETIVGRIVSGDSSAGDVTPEQREFAQSLGKTGFPSPAFDSERPGDRAGRGIGTAIMQGLVDRGWSKNEAAAAAGNAYAESRLDPGIQEKNPIAGRGGFGLLQWTGPRRRALERFADSRGTDASDLETQLDWLHQERGAGERGAYARAFGGGGSPEVLARRFAEHVERPADVSASVNTRQRAARAFAELFARQHGHIG